MAPKGVYVLILEAMNVALNSKRVFAAVFKWGILDGEIIWVGSTCDLKDPRRGRQRENWLHKECNDGSRNGVICFEVGGLGYKPRGTGDP